MRIISQDGVYDTPYETTQLWVQERNEVTDLYYIRGNMPADEAIPLAIYSSEEKALKAMEMLRKTYISMPIVMQNVDVSEDLEKEFERLKKCGVMVKTENQPSRVDFINNAVFQFPQDDEIEV